MALEGLAGEDAAGSQHFVGISWSLKEAYLALVWTGSVDRKVGQQGGNGLLEGPAPALGPRWTGPAPLRYRGSRRKGAGLPWEAEGLLLVPLWPRLVESGLPLQAGWFLWWCGCVRGSGRRARHGGLAGAAVGWDLPGGAVLSGRAALKERKQLGKQAVAADGASFGSTVRPSATPVAELSCADGIKLYKSALERVQNTAVHW